MTKTIEQRLQQLEDLEAIKDLTARYALHVNKGWNGKLVDVEAMPEIFAEDAVYESKDLKRYAIGLSEIVEGLKETEINQFAMHSFSNPILKIDGDEGKGNWLFWVISKRIGVANQVYMSMDFDYGRTENGWRIKKAHLHFGTMLSSSLS